MMKPVMSFAFALMMAAWSSGSQAKIVKTEISPPHTVVVRDLIGLTTTQVQRRLTGLDVDWPRTVGLEVSTGRGLLSFAAVDEYLLDPAATDLRARERTDAERLPKAWASCSVGPLPGPGGSVLLMFRGDRLEGVWGQRDAGADTTFRPADDALPLEDGDAFLAHWGRTLVDVDTRLMVRCARSEVVADPPAQARPGPEGLSASDMQGIALLPFAVGLPVMNGQRAAHRRTGAVLYAQMAPGYHLPGGPRAFVSRHGGVRMVLGRDPAYVVLKIDLGGYPSRNLSNSEDFGLVGVRDGVVVWRALEYSQASPWLSSSEGR